VYIVGVKRKKKEKIGKTRKIQKDVVAPLSSPW
jgi:hypothetical protein